MMDDDDTKHTPQEDAEIVQAKIDDHRWLLFLDTRKSYIAGQCDQSNLRDKYILTLSAAALALSITYIEKVVPLALATCVWLLIFSWLLFAFSLLSVVFSYYLSTDSYNHYIKQLDEKYEAGDDFQNITSPLDPIICQWNTCAMWAFVLGLIAFVAFAAINISNRTPT